MTTFFTADHHFGHANIIKYCNRPFLTVKQMDDALISCWNQVVGDEDVVFHLGDFTLGDGEKFRSYIRRLNGHICIVPGGHDERWTNQVPFMDIASKSRHDVMVLEPLTTVLPFPKPKDGHGIPVVLCHYAMRVWDRSHYGSWHLYGHSHGTLPGIGLSMDVGVDCNDFYPFSLAQIESRLSKVVSQNLKEENS